MGKEYDIHAVRKVFLDAIERLEDTPSERKKSLVEKLEDIDPGKGIELFKKVLGDVSEAGFYVLNLRYGVIGYSHSAKEAATVLKTDEKTVELRRSTILRRIGLYLANNSSNI